jgi:tight adherence protein B
MSIAILLVVLFIGVILIIEGLYLVVFGKSIKLNSRVNRRLALLQQGKDHEEVLNTLRKEREQHAKSKKVPLVSILGNKAAQANIAFSPKALIMIMVFLSVASCAALLLLTGIAPIVCVVISIAIGVGGVYVWLNKKAKARLELFEEQLPDAVELIVRSLRVGHPFSSAINVVAQEMSDPIGTEFGILADEATYGRD